MLHRCLEATEGRSDVEVIDLRSLRPLDTETIFTSVRKTHRALIVDEGWKAGSLSAEISARIMESCFYDLDAPVQRLCRREVPIPYARHLELAAIPQVSDISAKIMEVLS
jgi:pyruvate dehydrogenase E1 component beta subunit